MRFERIIFFNHLSIIGGMLAIVAFGAGCFSLDAAMDRKTSADRLTRKRVIGSAAKQSRS